MITLQVPRSLALVGDDAGCQLRFGEQERPGRGRQQARSSECLAKWIFATALRNTCASS